MRYVRAAALLILGGLVLAACSSGGGSTSANAPATDPAPSSAPSTTTDATTSTEPEPMPVTADERHWRRNLDRYTKRLHNVYARSGTITHASMILAARVDDECRKRLVKGQVPGRYGPAAKKARHACARLAKAAAFLRQAVSVSDAGGAVVAGTSEEQIFNHALNGSFEATGNAINELDRAVEVANEIALTLPQ